MRPLSRGIVLACLTAGAGLLPACGGGGGSSASSGYTIGGTVSGLTQLPGVVLENNGGDALTVDANGNFNFSTPLSAGTAYNVTVETSPAGQSCQVTGGGQGTASGRVSGVSVVCTSTYAAAAATNVAAISVNPGPADSNFQTFNIPQVSVTVCEPGNPNDCATIPNVLLDTGSSGLRLISSALPNGFVLPPELDGAGKSVFECMLFADGYSWGGVVMATVTVGGETTGRDIPVQIIDSNATSVPSACSNLTNNQAENTVDDFDANGVLGVGVFNEDCGGGCASTANNDIYYGCPTSASCVTEAMPLANQVANPVASFPTDNNGVILQLPALSTTGAATASGYLVFGIGTESASATEADNHLNGATVLTAPSGLFTTTFNGAALQYSFIDSGSNALYFPQPTPQLATCGTKAPANQFYCPTTTTSLSAKSQGANGAATEVSFQVANLLNTVLSTSFAIGDVGAIANPIDLAPGPSPTTSYFDWGLPFFYGRTVFTAIEGMTADGMQGPYYAY
jgi:Protein of unknown function (DUF3443)